MSVRVRVYICVCGGGMLGADAIARGEVPPPEPTPKSTPRARDLKRSAETAAALNASITADDEAEMIIRAAGEVANSATPLAVPDATYRWPSFKRRRLWVRMGLAEGLRASQAGTEDGGGKPWS